MPVTVRQRNLQSKNVGKKILASQKAAKKGGFWKSNKRDSEGDIIITNAPTDLKSIVYPGMTIAFFCLLSARLCSAIWNHITDCDETYNYWEPIHYLLYGNGMQTWEYSPLYALRSYASLWLFAGPAKLLLYLANVNPLIVFYSLRYFLVSLTAITEAFFYKAICHEFGVNIGRMWLAFTIVSCGGFISSSAMIPSAWCSIFTMAAMACWWLNRLPWAVFMIACSALIGWPFAGLLGAPIALDMLFRRKRYWSFIIWSMVSLVVILPALIVCDSWYYGKLVVAPWNIVVYNIFTEHGPNLYGVEPASYYLVNGFLNFNVVWVLSLICPLFLLVCSVMIPEAKPRIQFCQPYLLSLMPLYLWLAVFVLQPHKEERFLFPVYSLIPLCSAISVDCIQKITFTFKMKLIRICDRIFVSKKKSNVVNNGNTRRTHYLAHTTFIMVVFILVAMLGGLSRIVSLYRNYHAPMSILRPLSYETTDLKRINVCFGKDWYRSPSSFFLPDQRYRIRFIKSEFSGQMPAPYQEGVNGTRLVHSYFNDMNREDNSTYLVPATDCHYLVHSDIDEPSPLQPNYQNITDQWKVIAYAPILNPHKSDKLYRAFYVPFINSNLTSFGKLYLLRNLKFEKNFSRRR